MQITFDARLDSWCAVNASLIAAIATSSGAAAGHVKQGPAT
ncbi:hypothetical protein WMF30_19660 [Sorangium sp. So ce134]